MGRPTILVVDDQILVRFALEKLLSGEGYRVLTAFNWPDALLKLEETLPDLIIVDIAVPRLNGHDVLAMLCTRGIRLPVILMSAEPRLLDGQAVPTIAKPIDFDRLIELVAQQLANRGDGNDGVRRYAPSLDD